MPTASNPVGRPSAAVYRRRRLVVGLGLLLLILLIVFIVGRITSSAGAATDPAGTAAPVASETPAADAGGSEEESDPADAEDITVEECDPTLLEVVAVTDADEYQADTEPKLSFTITNTGTEVCTANVGTSTQVYTVSTGADVVWTSTDCQEDPSDQLLTLEPGTPVSSTPLQWERVRSSTDTCSVEEREPVIADGATYSLSVEAAGAESTAPKTFLLY